jgi:dTDP-4-dehydrorhamnose 3,5-epimerase
MNIKDINETWLASLKLTITSPYKAPTIGGVVMKELTPFLDGRGDVTELWSLPWVEKFNLDHPKHIYQSATDFGVIKAWHMHQIHTDQFTVTRGKLQVTLVDIREESPTFGHLNTVFMGSLRPRLLKIPPLVLHGWKALTEPEVLVVNLQTETYDPADEFKYRWDCITPMVWQPQHG